MNDPRRPAVRKAVALRYERGKDKAPRVVARGMRLRAKTLPSCLVISGISGGANDF